jgi:hypothetical protein
MPGIEPRVQVVTENFLSLPYLVVPFVKRDGFLGAVRAAPIISSRHTWSSGQSARRRRTMP